MEKKDKDLLLKDLCMRLPYEPWVWFRENWKTNPNFKGCQSQLRLYHLEYIVKDMDITLKPYLRPMSSMTEEEKETCEMFFNEEGLLNTSVDTYLDWLLENHFDYRGLIEKGLALPAPEGMYNF